jgi:hypothetical protein
VALGYTRQICLVLALATWACAGRDDATESLSDETLAAIQASDAEPTRTRAQLQELLEIGSITVLNTTVLEPDDFFAPLLNNLHFVTNKQTIADELNFKSGDKVHRWELYDASRYVRMLDPVKQAKVLEKYNPETGKTDITVVTRDKLSAYVRGGGSGSGGYSSFNLQAGETSLFGRLYTVGINYNRENFRDFVGLEAGKLRIGGTRWQALVTSTDGFANSMHNYQSRGITIGHPFTIDGQRHGFVLTANFTQGVLYDYLGGGIRKGLDTNTGNSFDLIYRRRTENINAEYLIGFGKKNRIEFGPGFQHFITRDYFIHPEDQYIVGDTRELAVSDRSKAFYQNDQFSTHAVSFAVNTRFGDYVPMKNFRRYLFTEDQFEGLRTSGKVTYADPAFGLSDHYTKASASATYQENFLRKKFRFETGIGRTSTFWQNRYDGPRDDTWNVDLRGFHFTHYGTVALRTYASAGNNLSVYARNLIAAEFTRGFFYGSISPSAGMLGSLEYRSPAWKLPYILLAGVAFFDYAAVGTTMDNLYWNPVAGIGLRSMLHEFDNNVFRLDLGFNLNDSNFNLLNSLQFGLNQTF